MMNLPFRARSGPDRILINARDMMESVSVIDIVSIYQRWPETAVEDIDGFVSKDWLKEARQWDLFAIDAC